MTTPDITIQAVPSFAILSPARPRPITEVPGPSLLRNLAERGAVLLRGFQVDLKGFAALVHGVSKRTTMDPARDWFAPGVQRVDSGTAAIGLHCENGTTPNPPDVVWFYCAVAARTGSQTTLCDGFDAWSRLAPSVRELFLKREVTFSRRVPEELWVPYLRHEHRALPEGPNIDQVVLDGLEWGRRGTRMTLDQGRNLLLEVTTPMVHATHFGTRLAWANSLLGPSYNYQPPIMTLDDGSPIPEWAMEEVQRATAPCISEIPWQDGDVIAIDNTRTMHGRRVITDSRRQLYTALSYI
jgi:hypothetical protein